MIRVAGVLCVLMLIAGCRTVAGPAGPTGPGDPCRGVTCKGTKDQYTCKWGRCVPIWVAKDAGAFKGDSKRFYAVGLITNVDREDLGRIASKRRCQVELAALLSIWVENVHKQYLRATASGKKVASESDFGDTAKTIVARHIRGTRYMDYYSNEYKHKYLALCSFDLSAAMKMYAQSKKLAAAERDWVRRNAAKAHAEHKKAIDDYLKRKRSL